MRSPFREPPGVELGSLDVGLEAAASRASTRLPRGGRLVDDAARSAPAPHRIGAVGSLGLFLSAVGVVVARSSGLEPVSARGLLAILTLVALGGGSLALVLSAVDRVVPRPTRRGELVGRAAGSVLRRLGRLATRATEDAPHTRFTSRHLAALRRAIRAARRPPIASFIPDDVVGRAELLVARSLARRAGPGWADDPERREEVRAWLVAASAHLDEAEPADADLARIDAAPPPSRRMGAGSARRKSRTHRAFGPRVEVACEPMAEAPDDLADDVIDDTEAMAPHVGARSW